ncbi:hypothetical protein GBA52_000101 [Prunus armeniaca]|nr:hypothetical protein GBA52_000101 [Prunus armeniaca]
METTTFQDKQQQLTHHNRRRQHHHLCRHSPTCLLDQDQHLPSNHRYQMQFPLLPTHQPPPPAPNRNLTPLKSPQLPQPTLSQRAISQTLTSTANLANLLPTGTLLAFQLLTPIFTSNGSCDSATRPMTLILLLLFALSCFVASLTDSVKASDGQVYYGLATTKGLVCV